MGSRFSDQVPLSNQAFSLLPVYHTCEGFDARNYIEANAIVTTDVCEVFREPITYLFYGRPAYKYFVEEEGTTNLSLYPVCFVLRIEKIGQLKRAFPFDTGAMFHKRLKRYIHHKNTVLDFQIDPTSNRINDLVFHFFGSAKNYISAIPSGKKFVVSDFESVAYAKMIDSYIRTEADERRVTIEIQAEATVQLSADSLQALILPTQLRSSPLVKDFVRKIKGLKIQSYDIEVWNPSQSFGLISAAAKRLTLAMGLLK